MKKPALSHTATALYNMITKLMCSCKLKNYQLSLSHKIKHFVLQKPESRNRWSTEQEWHEQSATCRIHRT